MPAAFHWRRGRDKNEVLGFFLPPPPNACCCRICLRAPPTRLTPKLRNATAAQGRRGTKGGPPGLILFLRRHSPFHPSIPSGEEGPTQPKWEYANYVHKSPGGGTGESGRGVLAETHYGLYDRPEGGETDAPTHVVLRLTSTSVVSSPLGCTRGGRDSGRRQVKPSLGSRRLLGLLGMPGGGRARLNLTEGGIYCFPSSDAASASLFRH